MFWQTGSALPLGEILIGLVALYLVSMFIDIGALWWRKRHPKPLLILDANGLLVHRKYVPDHLVPVPEGATRLGTHFTWKRPGLDAFLNHIFAHYRVGVWSSARADNVERICQHVFGERQALLEFQWDQSHCTVLPAQKDAEKPRFLKVLGEEHRDNVIIVDDSADKMQHNPKECVVITEPWDPERGTQGQTLEDVWHLIRDKRK